MFLKIPNKTVINNNKYHVFLLIILLGSLFIFFMDIYIYNLSYILIEMEIV